MRILLIGGNGFVGKPLARELIQDGNAVAILHRHLNGAAIPGVIQLHGDRNRLDQHLTEIRHFAPQIIIDMILSSGTQAEQVAGIAQSVQARLVAISSMDVYRAWGVMLGTEPGGLEPAATTEDSPLRSGSWTYPPEVIGVLKNIFTWITESYDKVSVEQTVMLADRDNTVVRLPMVYGPGDPLHRMHPVLKRIEDHRPAIILPDDYAAWRGPRGYVDNVARAIALAASSDAARGRIYHVCEEPCLSELEWQRCIAAQTDWRGQFIILPREKTPKHLFPAGNPAQHVVASSARIRSELGYREPVTTNEAIRRTIAWERANPPSGSTFHQFDYTAEDAALAA
jgi:nucleoside-diphosphate-sugar epimerase